MASRPSRPASDGDVVLEVAHAEGHVAGLVLEGQVGDAAGDRVGGVGLEEGEEVEERSLARGPTSRNAAGEVGLVEQGLQGRPPTDTRRAERAAAEQGPAGEDLDVAGLVGHLDGEQVHDLPEMRVDPAEETGRDHAERLARSRSGRS